MERLRSGTDSTSTRLLIGVALIFFVFFMGSGNQQKQTTVYATVDGVAVTDVEMRRVYAGAVRKAGRNLSETEEKQLRSDVLDGLIEQLALAQEATREDVLVSDDEVWQQIDARPEFADVNGKFNEKIYEKMLKQNGLTRASYQTQIRDAIQIDKLLDLVSQSVTVSEAEVKSEWTAQNTEVDLTYVRLPDTAFLDGIVVPDSERDAYATAHADEVQKRYTDDYERLYDLPKRFQMREILFRTDIPGSDKADVKARADAVRAQAVSGADFGALARRWSEDLTAGVDGNIGNRAADQLDTVLAAAAEAAGAGKVSEVVETGRGYAIVRVEAITDARVIPLEEARSDIAVALLREQKVDGVVGEYAARIIAAWQATGTVPRDLTEARKLSVDVTGPFSLAEREIPQIGDVPEIMATLRVARGGTVIATPFSAKGGRYVAAVTSRAEADFSTWDSGKTMVRAQLTAQRKMAFVTAWKQDVIAHASVDRTPTN